MFLDPQNHQFTAALKQAYPAIKRELLALGEHEYIVEHPLRHVYDFGWDMFGLYAFGKKIEACTALCPETTRVVEQIPGMVGAGFSILRAGATIDWHFDPQDYAEHVYRCHLGLVVPAGCHFTVGQQTKDWQEEGLLLFRGDQPHKAENLSGQDRIVLIVDVKVDLQNDFSMPAFNPVDWIPTQHS